MVEERADPCTGGGEPFDEGETGLGQGDPVGEVVLGVERRGEPVAEQSNHPAGRKMKPSRAMGAWEGGNLWLGVFQWMSSVSGVENLTSSWSPLSVRVRNRP